MIRDKECLSSETIDWGETIKSPTRSFVSTVRQQISWFIRTNLKNL